MKPNKYKGITVRTLYQLIREQFAQVGDSFVHEELQPNDFEFREVISWLGDVCGKHILDVGCGKARMVKALHSLGAIAVGVDPVWTFIQCAARRIETTSPLLVGEVEWLPFKDESFDGVVCVEVIEHVPNTIRALAEMARVLKPEGRLVVIDKNILGLDRKWLIPVALKKWWLERRGRWMYPPDFPFREKWFRPKEIKSLLECHFSYVEVNYLVSGRTLFPLLFKLFPQAQFYVSWRAIK